MVAQEKGGANTEWGISQAEEVTDVWSDTGTWLEHSRISKKDCLIGAEKM